MNVESPERRGSVMADYVNWMDSVARNRWKATGSDYAGCTNALRHNALPEVRKLSKQRFTRSQT